MTDLTFTLEHDDPRAIHVALEVDIAPPERDQLAPPQPVNAAVRNTAASSSDVAARTSACTSSGE